MSCHVDAHDLGALLMRSVRYALGRRSYAVSDTADMVRRYLRHASPDVVDVLLLDIGEALGAGQCGDKCDDDEWWSLYQWIAQEVGE